MPYSITLRSRTDETITGWYDGSSSRWSTDHTRQRLFDNKHDAKLVRDELRNLCPRNAKVISVEPEQADEKRSYYVSAASANDVGNEDRVLINSKTSGKCLWVQTDQCDVGYCTRNILKGSELFGVTTAD